MNKHNRQTARLINECLHWLAMFIRFLQDTIVTSWDGLFPATRDVARVMRVTSWFQDTELDIVYGSLCNLFAIAFL